LNGNHAARRADLYGNQPGPTVVRSADPDEADEERRNGEYLAALVVLALDEWRRRGGFDPYAS
jgi:hypothetical protein